MKCKDNENTAGCSRRQFFSKVGMATVAGAAATTLGPGLLRSEQAEAKGHEDKQTFPYKKLDPNDIMARAHEGYYKYR